jgi:predicted outer membrane repeat protein
MARGLIIAENRFFPRMEAALSFNYSRQLKLLLVLPGVYPAPGNCKSTINYDSVQIIGVCGHQFTKFDCNGSSFHFKVTGQNITIQGLQLMNGNSDENGGCIAITPPATGITIIDTFLLNCFSEKNGGAISFTDQLQESHSIAISILGESSIESCSAVNGGALYISMDSRSLPLKYFNCYWSSVDNLDFFCIFRGESSIKLLIAGTTSIISNSAEESGGGVAVELQRSRPFTPITSLILMKSY